MSKTRQQYPLSEIKPMKKTVVSMIGWLIVAIMVYVSVIFVLAMQSAAGANVSLSFLILTVSVIGALGIIFLLTYVYQKWYFEVYYYDLTDMFIVIRKGVVTPREITIPYERVQDIYFDQDIFDRLFGLYDVHLSSATFTSGMEAHIDGLEQGAAYGLRDLLMKTVSMKISRQGGGSQINGQSTVTHG